MTSFLAKQHNMPSKRKGGAHRSKRRKVAKLATRSSEIASEKPTLDMQDLQDHPIPESSIAASTVSRNVVDAARSPILAFPAEIRQMIYGYLLPC